MLSSVVSCQVSFDCYRPLGRSTYTGGADGVQSQYDRASMVACSCYRPGGGRGGVGQGDSGQVGQGDRGQAGQGDRGRWHAGRPYDRRVWEGQNRRTQEIPPEGPVQGAPEGQSGVNARGISMHVTGRVMWPPPARVMWPPLSPADVATVSWVDVAA